MELSEGKQKIVFSDIDGTLVHDAVEGMSSVQTTRGTLECKLTVDGQELSTEILPLPLSSTGQQGYISVASMETLQHVRQAGAKVVLISGARTSTVLERLPYLPKADAVVSENGGRIFYTDGHWSSCVALREDLEWRKQLEPVTGPLDNDRKPAAERVGLLWDHLRKFLEAGFKVDTRSYATAFRVQDSTGSGNLKDLLQSLPEGLASTVNLGKSDVYPAASGKQGAALRVVEHFQSDLSCCAFMCDDDNDIDLAKVVACAYLPSISADTMRKVAAADPQHFKAANLPFVFGTEQAVQQLAADWGSKTPSSV